MPWISEDVLTRARGRSSQSALNRKYPHQVLVLSDSVRGPTFDSVFSFHENLGVPIKNRTIRKGDEWYLLYRFAEKKVALAFQDLFGGELFER